MEEIIKVTTNENGEGVVSARELHEFLEVKNGFASWFADNKEQFTEGVDYQALRAYLVHENGVGGTHKTDYALTLDCAKELAMMSKVPKGKQARQYFIACEKKLREVSTQQNIGSGKVLEALNIFNAGMQACTSLDMWKSMASERANHLAMEHTGVDILKGLGITDDGDGPRDPRWMLY